MEPGQRTARPRVLCHVLPAAAWAGAAAAGALDGASLRLVGPGEVAAEAGRAYGPGWSLVVLRFDAAELAGLGAGEAVPVDMVVEVEPLPWTAAGYRPSEELVALAATGGLELELAARLAAAAMWRFDGRWWVAGGWSVSLAAGRRTRPHADLEVSVLRRDHARLFAALPGWELRLAGPATGFARWRGEPLPGPVHQCWARPGRSEEAPSPALFAADREFLDVLFELADGDEWVYRRDERVRLPLDRFGTESAGGVPIVRPEVSLLYKARTPRWKDERDLRTLLPGLDTGARRWLRDAVALAHPASPWLDGRL